MSNFQKIARAKSVADLIKLRSVYFNQKYT